MVPGTVEGHGEEKKRRKRVLIIEDDFLTRWEAAEYLRETGFDVFEAISVSEAKAILGIVAAIDAIFYAPDPVLERDGHEFSLWVAQQYPPLPILVAAAESTSQGSRGKTPIRRFVAKPYELPEIERQLIELAAGK